MYQNLCSIVISRVNNREESIELPYKPSKMSVLSPMASISVSFVFFRKIVK